MNSWKCSPLTVHVSTDRYTLRMKCSIWEFAAMFDAREQTLRETVCGIPYLVWSGEAVLQFPVWRHRRYLKLTPFSDAPETVQNFQY